MYGKRGAVISKQAIPRQRWAKSAVRKASTQALKIHDTGHYHTHTFGTSSSSLHRLLPLKIRPWHRERVMSGWHASSRWVANPIQPRLQLRYYDVRRARARRDRREARVWHVQEHDDSTEVSRNLDTSAREVREPGAGATRDEVYHYLVHLRDQIKQSSSGNQEHLFVAVQRLASKFQSGIIEPGPSAASILLYLFEDLGRIDAGISLSKWLQTNAQPHIKLDSAAIALAKHKQNSLSWCESHFLEAVRRLPDQHRFSTHASEAGKSSSFSADETNLIGAIVRARFLHGDSANAYLGVELLSRAGADEKNSKFLLGHRVRETPIAELCSFFIFLCNNVRVPLGSDITPILKRLDDQASVDSDLSAQAPALRIQLIEVGLDLLRVHTIHGASCDPQAVGSILSCFRRLIIVVTVERRPSVAVADFNKRLIASAVKLIAALADEQIISAATVRASLWDILAMAQKAADVAAIKAISAHLEQVGATAEKISQHVISVRSGAYAGDLGRVRTSWAALVKFEPGIESWLALARALRRGFATTERYNQGLNFLKDQFVTMKPKDVALYGLIAEYSSRALDSEHRPDRVAARRTTEDLSPFNALIEEAVTRLVQCVKDHKDSALNHGTASRYPDLTPTMRSRVSVQRRARLLIGSSPVPRPEAFESQYRQLYMELAKSITSRKPSMTRITPNDFGNIRHYEVWRDINRLLAAAAGASEAYRALDQAGVKLPYLGSVQHQPQVARDFASIQYLRTWDGELGIGLDASYEQMRQRIMQLRGPGVGRQLGSESSSSMRQSGLATTVTTPTSDPVNSQRHFHHSCMIMSYRQPRYRPMQNQMSRSACNTLGLRSGLGRGSGLGRFHQQLRFYNTHRLRLRREQREKLLPRAWMRPDTGEPGQAIDGRARQVTEPSRDSPALHMRLYREELQDVIALSSAENREQLVREVERFARHIQAGHVKSTPLDDTFVIYLFDGLGEFDSALDFCGWLRNNGRLNLGAYAAMIEVMNQTGVSLMECESLFREATSRFQQSGEFRTDGKTGSRHLSFTRDGIRLWTAIISARLARGNFRDAYLGLDTLTQGLGNSKLERQIIPRPARRTSIGETAILFRIIARGGETLIPSQLSEFLMRLANADRASQLLRGRERPMTEVELLLLALDVFKLFAANGDLIEQRHLTALLMAWKRTIIPVLAGAPVSKEVQTHNRKMIAAAVRLAAGLVDAQLLPKADLAENSFAMLGMAVRAADSAIIKSLLAHIDYDEIARTYVGDYLILISSAATLGDLDGIRAHWKALVQSEPGPLHERTWKSLAISLRTGLTLGPASRKSSDFLRQQLSIRKLPHDVSPHFVMSVFQSQDGLENESQSIALRTSTRDLTFLGKAVDEAADSIIDFIKSRVFTPAGDQRGACTSTSGGAIGRPSFVASGRPGDTHNSSTLRSVFEQHLRRVYEELTTRKASDSVAKPVGSHRSHNNLIGSESYEHWKDINRLLVLSEAAEWAKRNLQPQWSQLSLKPGDNEEQLASDWRGTQVLKHWDGELGIGLDASYDRVRRRIKQLREIP